MNFFKALKRSLGFGGGDAEDDDTTYADTAEDQAEEQPQPETPTEEAAEPAELEFDTKMQELIFAKVVEVFNASLPKFVADTVDNEAQQKYLRDALDQGIKNYMAGLNQQAQKTCESRWEKSRSAMVAELEAMRSKADGIEKKSDDILQKQLSADRQKRALSDRVHDLEAQIAKMVAEREQFDLENRSLVNRLKVANVQAVDLEKANEEVARLQAEVLKLRQNPGAAQTEEIEALKAQLAEAEEKANGQTAEIEAKTAEIEAKAVEMESKEAEIGALKAQIDEMQNGIDSMREQSRVSTEMFEDTRKKLSAAEKDAAEKAQQLAEAQEMLKEYDDVTSKLEQIDAIMTRNEQKIKKQKSQLAERDNEIEALRNTISENMRQQAEREKALQDEIKALKGNDNIPQISFAENTTEDDNFPQISEDELSEIEQTFESGEWFTKTPPAETPSMRPKDDGEFGYREPQRKTNNGDNSLQLSLF